MIELKSLSDRYIDPNSTTVNKCIRIQSHRMNFRPALTNTVSCFAKTGANYFNPSVTHEDILYPSFDSSRKILNNNKTAYLNIMKTLTNFENSKLTGKYLSVTESKKKLDFFKYHSRKTALQKGIFIYP